jgi:zinc protease
MSHRFTTTMLRAGGLTAGVLMLAQAALTGQAAQAAPPLPAARDLIARHVKAIGGAAAFRKVQSIRAVGTFEMASQGITGSLEMLSARPDRMLLRVDVASVGHIETGYDGKVGWSVDPLSGPALLSGRQLSELADDAWFDDALHGPDHVQELTTVERTDFDKRPAYKVHVVYKSGNEQFEYFDAQTGLEIGSESQRDTPMGVVPTSTVLRDYQKFGPLMQPTTLVQRTMGIEQVFHLTSFEYDKVPSNAFAMPPSIKALIK